MPAPASMPMVRDSMERSWISVGFIKPHKTQGRDLKKDLDRLSIQVNWVVRLSSYGFMICGTAGFPATCPYVTSVGATQINPGSNVTQPESACEQVIFSGGGFSNHFAMPAYQKKAVHQYLKKYKPNYPPELWNSTGIVREKTFFLAFRSKLIMDTVIRVVVIQIYPRMGTIFLSIELYSTGHLDLTLLFRSANYAVAVCITLSLEDLTADTK